MKCRGCARSLMSVVCPYCGKINLEVSDEGSAKFVDHIMICFACSFSLFHFLSAKIFRKLIYFLFSF